MAYCLGLRESFGDTQPLLHKLARGILHDVSKAEHDAYEHLLEFLQDAQGKTVRPPPRKSAYVTSNCTVSVSHSCHNFE